MTNTNTAAASVAAIEAMRTAIGALLNEFGERHWQSGHGVPHKSIEDAFEAIIERAALAAPAQAVVPADHSGDNFGSAEHWKEKAQYWAGVAHRMRQEALRGEPVDGIVPVHPAVPAQAGEYPELPAPLVLESGYGPGDVPDAYTADQMRAYADATCAARGAAQAAASIFISEGGDREFDDWKVPLPVGRNVLYTRPAPQAQAAPVDAAASNHWTGEQAYAYGRGDYEAAMIVAGQPWELFGKLQMNTQAMWIARAAAARAAQQGAKP